MCWCGDVETVAADKSSVCLSVLCVQRFVCELERQLSTFSSEHAADTKTTIVTNENTKIIVETALISGVIPAAGVPKSPEGVYCPARSERTQRAISSIDSVKINSAAPIIGSFKFAAASLARTSASSSHRRSRDASSCARSSLPVYEDFRRRHRDQRRSMSQNNRQQA